jgi:hypothetical protein
MRLDMYCPKCGSTQPNDLRFCKQCGANLAAVRVAVERPEVAEKFDWSNTWVAEMFMSGEDAVRRAAEIERLQGLAPETRRQKEIKAGVITASVGIALSILLLVLMGGIIASGRISDAAAEILSRLWVVGMIPIFVGAALIFNGMFISTRSDEKRLPASEDPETNQLPPPTSLEYLPPADTNELISAPDSVTDHTTKHLRQER